MRNLILLLLSGLFISIFVPVEVWPQDNIDVHNQLKFRHITIDNGLTHNRVLSICQDQYGYTWIATYFGLNRYDGMEIKTFYHKSDDSLSLPSNVIWSIFCDSRGTLWVGTNEGLCYYNECDNRFVRFRLKGMIREVDDVYDIMEDGNKNLWFAAIGGLILYMPQSDSTVCFNSRSSDQRLVLPADTVYRVLEDDRNTLWLSLYDKGICWINKDRGVTKHFMNIPGDKNSLSDNRVEKIFQDSRGDIWIGTLNGGLNLLNRSDSTFARFQLDKHDSYSTRVRVIYEDPDGSLFFGTRAGLYLYDPSERNFILYANTAHKFSTLSANSILCSYIDEKEGLWLGTHYGGVNYSNFGYRPFVAHYAKDNDQNFLNNPSVFGINEDSKGNIYICTEKGVNILLTNRSTFEYIVNDPANNNSLSYSDVKSIAIDEKDNLWIGTNRGGLNYYNRYTGKFFHYKNKPGDQASLPCDKVYFVYLDRNKDLWLLTNESWGLIASSLSVLKHNGNRFKTFSNDFYGGIIESAGGNLYIGGLNGIWVLNKNTGRMLYYKSQYILHVMALHEDASGNLWIGSDRGLSRFDPRTRQYTHFLQIESYSMYSVFGVLSDQHNNLWISTNAGLIKMINAVISTDSLSLRLYNKDDGLPSKEFIYNAFFKSKRGEMFFGTNNGLVRFFPDQIKENTFEPNVVISELFIGDELIMPGDKVNERIVLTEPIQNTKSVTIDYKTKVFTLKFNALHYANPEKNRFKYKLENFDSDWKYANAYNNYVTYTSLPKGNYVFTVYAANNDGVYCDSPAVLSIRVLPPFWQTWLFRILAMLLLSLGAVATFRLRLRTVKRQKEMLQTEIGERTAELSKSYTELQEQKYEILAQNEKMQIQQKHIEDNNLLLETAIKKLQLLNEFGRQITTIHNKQDISKLINQYLRTQVDINIIGLGIYDYEKQGIVYADFTEEGLQLSEFVSKMDDDTSMGVYCYKHNEIILCNDFENEYKKYITRLKIRTTRTPKSVIYIPLMVGNKKIGILTLQSYIKNAFSGQIIPFVESMASIIAIALDNAYMYEVVRNQNEILEKKKEFLEHLVKERTRDLERAKNKAEESDKLKSAFLANMSHEIRTPLNAIIGFIELLNQGINTPEEVFNYYQIIKNSGFALLQLINDIIDFSRMEAGQIEFYMSSVQLDTLLSDIYMTFSEEIKKAKSENKTPVQLKMRLLPEHRITIPTDSVRLQQILNNLLSNAIKFTHEGLIEFGVREIATDREITLFVRDTGIGIEKKYHQAIFNRFIKIDDDRNVLYRGTGLGLAITKHLVETLGGKIWVESEPGKGSEFIFRLPIVKHQGVLVYPAKNLIKSDESIPDWSQKHFLIVEDEESNYRVLNSMLRKTSAATSWAKDGEEAVRLYQQQMELYNLILLDIKLPKKDGFQAIREIKSLNPQAVVIAQTAYALSNEESMIYDAGFDGYLVKPITMQSLIQAISPFV
ncbi:MAG: response regulator [Bacteroidales bacterium]|nr:response regulator [Bacteroidales bacterium]